jgi:hypothetical protein
MILEVLQVLKFVILADTASEEERICFVHATLGPLLLVERGGGGLGDGGDLACVDLPDILVPLGLFLPLLFLFEVLEVLLHEFHFLFLLLLPQVGLDQLVHFLALVAQLLRAQVVGAGGAGVASLQPQLLVVLHLAGLGGTVFRVADGGVQLLFWRGVDTGD